MAKLDLRGQRIHYADSGGPGPAVVFSHGFLCDGSPFTFWDSAGDRGEQGPAAVADEMGRHHFNDPAAAAPWLEKWRAEPRERHRHRATALIEAEDVTPRLQELEMPALLIVGGADDGVPLEEFLGDVFEPEGVLR